MAGATLSATGAKWANVSVNPVYAGQFSLDNSICSAGTPTTTGRPLIGGLCSQGQYHAWTGFEPFTTKPSGLVVDIATDDRGYVYVVQEAISTLRIFSSDMSVQLFSGSVDTEPTGVSVFKAPDGEYYAYVSSINNVKRYKVTAPEVTTIDNSWFLTPSPGSGLTGVEVDQQDGSVYVAAPLAVRRYDASGQLSATSALFTGPIVGITAFKDRVYLVESTRPPTPVYVLDKLNLTDAGNIPVPFITLPGGSFSTPPTGYGTFARNTGIDISSDGVIYVSQENIVGDANSITGLILYTPPATSFNPTPTVMDTANVGKGPSIYFDRVIAFNRILD